LVGAEEIAAVGKGISAAAKAAKASRFGLKILEILEKIPALKRLLDALRGASRVRVAAEVAEAAKAREALKAREAQRAAQRARELEALEHGSGGRGAIDQESKAKVATPPSHIANQLMSHLPTLVKAASCCSMRTLRSSARDCVTSPDPEPGRTNLSLKSSGTVAMDNLVSTGR
jgi:hypothetical protein